MYFRPCWQPRLNGQGGKKKKHGTVLQVVKLFLIQTRNAHICEKLLPCGNLACIGQAFCVHKIFSTGEHSSLLSEILPWWQYHVANSSHLLVGLQRKDMYRQGENCKCNLDRAPLAVFVMGVFIAEKASCFSNWAAACLLGSTVAKTSVQIWASYSVLFWAFMSPL